MEEVKNKENLINKNIVTDKTIQKARLAPEQYLLFEKFDENVFRDKIIIEEFKLGKGYKVSGFKSEYKDDETLQDIRIPSVYRGEPVLAIDFGAFLNCYNIKSVRVDDGVKIILCQAFDNCYKLSKVELPDSIIDIKESAFSHCDNLKEINLPSQLKILRFEIFNNCINLKKIFIPASVECIYNSCDDPIPGLYILDDAPLEGALSFLNLENIEVDKNNKNFYCENNCLIEKDTKKLVRGCADSIIPKDITKICDFSFSGCKTLKKIVIPEGVTEIGSYAFARCDQLEEIQMPESLQIISCDAFGRCKNLNNLYIPANVENIELDLFNDFVSNPFMYMNLDNIEVDKNNKKYYSENNCLIEKSTKKLIRGCNNSVIPDDVKEIGPFAFSGCKTIKNIRIPNCVIQIDPYAFFECNNLQTVIVSKSVQKIYEKAFSGGYLKFYFEKEHSDAKKAYDSIIKCYYFKCYYYNDDPTTKYKNIFYTWHYGADKKTPVEIKW